jgi:predicted aminopeptidase
MLGIAAGCSELHYYAQAAKGQASLLLAARPIDDWLQDPSLDGKVRTRLQQARKIREFAVAELALPQNGSYQSYVDIGRAYVLWNVVATDEFSFTPRAWCFPVAGCVTYRGYYAKDAAQGFANELRGQGADVQVSGVPAYSTLGWFNDPLISSFIYYPESELARLMFHELSHQILYVAGDTRFNESFASTVEEAGLQRWLAARGDARLVEAYAAAKTRRKEFLALLLSTRQKLEANYASTASDEAKREEKARLFLALQAEYQGLKQQWGGYAGYDRWFEQPLSNAHWVALANYEEFVPGFRALLAQQRDFPAFYAAARALGQLPAPEREQELRRLGRE